MSTERAATALDALDRARRTAKGSELRITLLRDGFHVEQPVQGLARWREIATFKTREHLEVFLVAMLPPPRDHVRGPGKKEAR